MVRIDQCAELVGGQVCVYRATRMGMGFENPGRRMLPAWPRWIQTTTPLPAGSLRTIATTLIAASVETLWWRLSTIPTSSTLTFEARAEKLRARRESGEDVDRLERITGRTYTAGYRRQQRDAHLLKRAIEHGVAPVLEDLDLPPNVSAVRAARRSSDPG